MAVASTTRSASTSTWLPQERVRPLHHQLAVQRVDPGDPAAHVDRVVPLHDPLDELLVALPVGPDVHVEDVGLGVGHLLLEEQACLAVYMQQTLEQYGWPWSGSRDPTQATKTTVLGSLWSEGRRTLPLRRARGVHQPLELEAGDHVGDLPLAVFPQLRLVPQVEARGHHDGPEGLGEDLVLLLELDGPRRADLLADPAAPLLDEVRAVLPVDDGHVGHRLGEGHVDGLPLAHAHLELGRDLDRALLVADPAAGALLHVHAAGPLADLDLEVAHDSRRPLRPRRRRGSGCWGWSRTPPSWG